MKHHQFQYSLILTASLCLTTSSVSWGQNGINYKGIAGNTSDMVKSTISNTVSGVMQPISGMGANTLANPDNISNGNRNINPFTGHEITLEEKERLITKQRLDTQIIEEQIHQKELRNKYEMLDLKKIADIATIKAAIKTSNRDLNGGSGNYNSFSEVNNNNRKKSVKTKVKYNKNIDSINIENINTPPVVISPLPKIEPITIMTPPPPSNTSLLPSLISNVDTNDNEENPKILGVMKKNGKWQALVDFKGKVNSISSGKSVDDNFSIDEVSANTVKANGKVTKIEKKLSKLPNEIINGNVNLGGFLPSSIPQPITQAITIPALK